MSVLQHVRVGDESCIIIRDFGCVCVCAMVYICGLWLLRYVCVIGVCPRVFCVLLFTDSRRGMYDSVAFMLYHTLYTYTC